MQLAFHANTEQKQVFLAKGVPATVQVQWFEEGQPVPTADAYFDLAFEENGRSVFTNVHSEPLFVNAVLAERGELADNMVRINAWPGFFERALAEVAAMPSMADAAGRVMAALNWQYQFTPDMPGMIAARIIAMIVNEAYFGLGDGISTRAEIDTAMKLGTNYPYGPFEWSEKIGLKNICVLLEKLNKQDERYAPAPALLEDLAAIKR